MIDYPIIFYQKIKFYKVETMNTEKIPMEQWYQWDDSDGTMVLAENAIVVSTMARIVQDKILF